MNQLTSFRSPNSRIRRIKCKPISDGEVAIYCLYTPAAYKHRKPKFINCFRCNESFFGQFTITKTNDVFFGLFHHFAPANLKKRKKSTTTTLNKYKNDCLTFFTRRISLSTCYSGKQLKHVQNERKNDWPGILFLCCEKDWKKTTYRIYGWI